MADTIRSGRETWLDDAAATPRSTRVRVLLPGTMEGIMRSVADRVRGAHHPRYRRHVDLRRVTSAACRG
ncbi:hypothetical protein C8E95_1571 [Pseudonocardia autotrophica]|uniref:Uncharacterized protein n=2 Tax=Pseudonocardia TaxID=1847 RepID=A0A1Y2MRH6_PSEAH|nr:hypothetical protein BG845_04446 [Pseudonocardia autotrophica]TDN72514.1 hypothetical protein C8E95_1571 [Pseudonocardia autotrophica]BBG03223.1 hypothetical protein Pdca_44320 [Pseudonocardia autotrophica]GEC23840.1 hypothetical protein PSA01_08690 [Pseudonocardia saturnea]